MWFHGWWSWGALAMTAVMALFWVVVLWLLVATHRASTWWPPPPARPSTTSSPEAEELRTAEQILAERLARGEIDEDEYQHRLDTLRDARASRR